MKDPFDSVSHNIFNNNLTKINSFKSIRDIIMVHYNEAAVKIIILDGVTNFITIKRRIKQIFPFDPVLFYTYILAC
jgi:hypothetical protein